MLITELFGLGIGKLKLAIPNNWSKLSLAPMIIDDETEYEISWLQNQLKTSIQTLEVIWLGYNNTKDKSK